MSELNRMFILEANFLVLYNNGLIILNCHLNKGHNSYVHVSV